MFIKIEKECFELKTTLGTASRLEKKYKMPLSKLFGNIGEADIDELLDIIGTAANDRAAELKEMALDNWDFGQLQKTVMELLGEIMFSGTPEEKERKIQEFPGDEASKNGLRAMLNLPIALIGAQSSEPDTE